MLANVLLFLGLWATPDPVTFLTLLRNSLALPPEAFWKTRSAGVAPSPWTHVLGCTASILLAFILAIGFFSVHHLCDNMASSYFGICTSTAPHFAVGQHYVAIITLDRGGPATTPEAIWEADALWNKNS